MINMSLFIPKGDNLCTYYLLPLLGINKKTFGRPFKTTLVSKDGLKLYVHLRRKMLTPTYRHNKYYISELELKEQLYVIFTIPSEHIKDSRLFVKGKYSHMSKEAKQKIYKSSTLPFNKKSRVFTLSSPILQALDRTSQVRNLLQGLIGDWVADDAELIDAPHADWFIEHRIIKI